MAALLICLSQPEKSYAQGTCATYKSYLSGDSFGPSDINSIQVLLGQTNMIGTCVDDNSASASAMQETRNPFPSDVVSLATNLKEELTGLRHVVQTLTGWTYWYEHSDNIRRAQTWNTAATNFCAFCVAVTDTASHAGSRLLDLIIVSGGSDVSKFAVVKDGRILIADASGTTTQVLHGSASGPQAWAAVSLTADVTGLLPTANGGTGQSTWTQGDILYSSATDTLAKLGAGTSGYFLKTQGAGANPIWAANALTGLTTIQFVRKTSNETISNSTTLQDDDALVAALAANEVASFECSIHFITTSSSSDIKVAFTVPTGAALRWGTAGHAIVSTSDVVGTSRSINASGTALSFSGDNADQHMLLVGTVVNGVNAGNLQLQWAQVSGVAENLTVYTNSFCVIRRV